MYKWNAFIQAIDDFLINLFPPASYDMNPADLPMNLPVAPAVNAPVSRVTPPPAPTSMLEEFCTAIRDYEGKPGDLNYMLNNPGDCRPSPDGYLAKYEPVEIIDTNTNPHYLFHKGSFAKFPSYAIGWEYLVNLVSHTIFMHPNWTFVDFFNHYAPSSDANNPNAYAAYVAGRLAVPKTYQIKLLV